MVGFSVPLAALAEKMKADLETVVRKSTFSVFRNVVLKSPVDTGRFRHNWNASYGAPNEATTAGIDQQRGVQEAMRAAGLPVGGLVYFTNGLPYAQRLENGYSQQAPAGMVRLSALEFSDSVQKALAK